MNAIEVRALRKVYRRYSRRKQFSTLKSALLSGSVQRDLAPGDGFEALKGVTFHVPAGRSVGLIGRNGSGKSSLLKLLAGIGKPTGGHVAVSGRVSALIELGAGFHPEISGRENVFINGMMLGLSKREVSERFEEIVTFAGLAPFIDAPVKTYSSGMYMRLGFAVAIHVDPDVLLVDEVLAVGDEAFTHKCLDKLADLRRRGKTIVLVTHSLDLVTRYCDEAIWLDAGEIRGQGDPKRVIDAYLLDVNAQEEAQLSGDAAARSIVSSEAPADMYQALEGRWGSREVEIVSVDLLRPDGQTVHLIASGDALEIRAAISAKHPVDDLVIGVAIFAADGTCCFGTNTAIDGATSGAAEGDGEVRFCIDHLDLTEGTYKLDVAVHRRNGAPYDYHRQLYTLRVTSTRKDVGVFRPPHHWRFGGAVRVSGLP